MCSLIPPDSYYIIRFIITMENSLMRDRSDRRVLPLKFFLVCDVDHPVADVEEAERRRENYARHSIDVRHAVYVSRQAIAIFSITTSCFALSTSSAILNIYNSFI